MQVSCSCHVSYTIELVLVLYIIFNIYIHTVVIIIKSILFILYYTDTDIFTYVYNVSHILIHINQKLLYAYLQILQIIYRHFLLLSLTFTFLMGHYMEITKFYYWAFYTIPVAKFSRKWKFFYPVICWNILM